jgi:hypothetical protein
LPKVAKHGMVYFIFLKYLRSLEEFRKNPCVQIPHKSPCANFQSLDIFKNSIFIRKEFFFNFQPIRPFWPRAAKPAKPTHQATPPLPLPPSLTKPAAPPPPPLAPPRCPYPTPWSDPNRRPLLNSAACLYSVVNPPSSLRVTGAFMAGY